MMDNETPRRNRELFLKVESELKKLPMELQEAFWNAPINTEMFDIVLDTKASNEEKSRKLSAFFVGDESESSWEQLRRTLYPLFHKQLSGTISLNVLLYNFFKDSNNIHLSTLFVIFAAVLVIIDLQGDPDDDSP